MLTKIEQAAAESEQLGKARFALLFDGSFDSPSGIIRADRKQSRPSGGPVPTKPHEGET